jgi:hypothetical protein
MSVKLDNLASRVTEFVARLDAINDDTESSHLEADQILVAFVRLFAPAVADAYIRELKRNGAWYA